MNLLDKAKRVSITYVKNVSSPTPEMLELSIAYAKHEITGAQGATALFGESAVKSKKSATLAKFQNAVAQALMGAVRDGQLVASR